MSSMSLFDLLFLLLAFLAAASLIAAIVATRSKRYALAVRILRILGLAASIYMVIVIAVSIFALRRIIPVRQPQCFDDWCITVENISRADTSNAQHYLVELRLLSRARRISQRENNLAVYLTDAGNRRYAPASNPADEPFNVLLGPGESKIVTRAFSVPSDVQIKGLITPHEGGFPIGWFIIGYDTWFRRPAILPLK